MLKYFLPLICLFLNLESLRSQADTIPPVLQCSAPAQVGIITGAWTFWAEDFIVFVQDNQTVSDNIQTGVRKACTGEGFPEEEFWATYYWEQHAEIEVWVRDEAGNTNTCVVSFDINYIVKGGEYTMNLSATRPLVDSVVAPIKQVTYSISGINCLGETFTHIENAGNAEIATFGGIPGAGYTIRIDPRKDINPLNGVTTNDLVLISRHILGIEPLDSPYKIIAADANQDGKVTIFDVVVLRKLILGITDTLPNEKSWRFIPEQYVFPNPANPFQTVFPEYIEVPNTMDIAQVGSNFKFKGIKIGDVDFSTNPNQ